MLGTTEDPETGQMLYTPRIGRAPKEPKPWQKQGAVGRQAKHTGTALHDSRHEIRAKRTALEQARARTQRPHDPTLRFSEPTPSALTPSLTAHV